FLLSIAWAPHPSTGNRKGTLAIGGNRMGYPCDWSKETLPIESMGFQRIRHYLVLSRITWIIGRHMPRKLNCTCGRGLL
ncbi:uncharacterized protein METZ01_LOCUS311208, partial [marine metagenome]